MNSYLVSPCIYPGVDLMLIVHATSKEEALKLYADYVGAAEWPDIEGPLRVNLLASPGHYARVVDWEEMPDL